MFNEKTVGVFLQSKMASAGKPTRAQLTLGCKRTNIVPEDHRIATETIYSYG